MKSRLTEFIKHIIVAIGYEIAAQIDDIETILVKNKTIKKTLIRIKNIR